MENKRKLYRNAMQSVIGQRRTIVLRHCLLLITLLHMMRSTLALRWMNKFVLPMRLVWEQCAASCKVFVKTWSVQLDRIDGT